MFRAASTGPFEEAVAKATDENLTSEDWAAIMEVCDKVAADPASGPKDAVQSMIRRLAHRNANVQLYTLELAHALCQNGGKPIHREISSRAFTDALLKLASDRNTHTQVKAKIMEKLGEWSGMFSGDADLGIVYDAYFRLKQSQPSLQAPSAPGKRGLTRVDREKEEEELQMALRLSLQDEERKNSSNKGNGNAGAATSASSSSTAAARQPEQGQGQGQGQSLPPGTTAATVSRVRALFDFVPTEPGELEFKRGDVIAVLESVYKDWWRGSLKGQTGIFPLNYVEKLADPTPDELQREAQMEAEVFAEIKNVEKLLTLLSASNTAPREEDNEEISKLYHQTLAIRPKLIKLIEKYSQKKDDFTQLNEKFIKARRDYEALLESSMAHPPQPNYHQYAIRPGLPPQELPLHPSQQQQQDPQRFYTPGAANPYQPSPPPSNFQPYPPTAGEVPIPTPNPNLPYPSSDTRPDLPQPMNPNPPVITKSPGPIHSYTPYSQPPQNPNPNPPQPWNRLSTHGAQELATSVYDAPAPGPAYPPSQAQGEDPRGKQPAYQSYQPQNPSEPGPGPGPGYDGRQRAPSQPGEGQGQQQQGPQQGQQQQYKPYTVPEEASAPAASDYYRQSGIY